MQLEAYRPQSCLVSKTTAVTSPRFPVIDAHNHLSEQLGSTETGRQVEELVEQLDRAGVRLFVDLDGGWGEEILQGHIDQYKTPYPERFLVFGGINWEMWEKLGEEFPQWAAERLVAQKNIGADGLKIWKNLGLKVRDHEGTLVGVDDSRLAPIWAAASELKLPVMIHVADPVAFFKPLDEMNERWEELIAHPDWHFPSPPFPAFSDILEGLGNLVRSQPRTTFIGAHVGCYAENLGWVGSLLDECPNFFVDMSARVGELGRQPYTSRQFFHNYADRILFGSDFGPDLEEYQIMYRFLETDDQYFNYNAEETPQQGRWYVYGIHLPDEILQKVYYLNAERILLNKS